MKSVQLLDVSLRDGGHRLNFSFDDAALDNILLGLDLAGVDYIELGYRKGLLSNSTSLGVAGLSPNEFISQCRSRVRQAKLAIMAHPGNINAQDIREMKAAGVDLLRICLSRGDTVDVLPIIRQANDAGLKTSVNFIHVSQYELHELETEVQTVINSHPNLLYFADSNGAMLPRRVAALFQRLSQLSDRPLGFHAHDNLGLAQANALAALDNGASFIDASLCGIGKGTGNLKMEFFAACLQALDIGNYHVQPLVEAANYIHKNMAITDSPLLWGEFVRGLEDLSTSQLKALKSRSDAQSGLSS